LFFGRSASTTERSPATDRHGRDPPDEARR